MFDISFESMKAIKGQVLTDFIVELTRPTIESISDPIEGRKHSMLMMDGSSTVNECGAGIICQSLEGDMFEYALRFQFHSSNNETEYEQGSKCAKRLGL